MRKSTLGRFAPWTLRHSTGHFRPTLTDWHPLTAYFAAQRHSTVRISVARRDFRAASPEPLRPSTVGRIRRVARSLDFRSLLSSADGSNASHPTPCESILRGPVPESAEPGRRAGAHL